MIKKIIPQKKLTEFQQLLSQSHKIVITTHLSPDGDAIGSSLAFEKVLNTLGKDARIIIPDMMIHSLTWLPGAKEIIVYTRYEEFAQRLIAEADLIICLDYNSLKRIDRVGKFVAEAKAPKVMIDHHLDPDDFATIQFSYPQMSSTCCLLFNVLCGLELAEYIDRDVATCIYAGMMTDTGNFTYNDSDPDIYVIIAELVRRGIHKDEIYRKIVNVHSLSSLQLNGYAISQKLECLEELHSAIITLDKAELKKYTYCKGDTEGLVNVPLSIPGIWVSAYLREETDYIKVSMRSLGDIAVNKICEELFGGGGHKNAAGGDFHGTMDECVALLKEKLREEPPTMDHNLQKRL